MTLINDSSMIRSCDQMTNSEMSPIQMGFEKLFHPPPSEKSSKTRKKDAPGSLQAPKLENHDF